jgi:hypothetical protein
MEIALPSGLAVDFGESSQEEIQDVLEAMREQDPSLFEESVREPQNISELIASRSSVGEGADGEGAAPREPDFVPTVEGDVTNSADRWAFGKEDISSEKEAFLTRTYGPDSFGKDNRGRHYLILDNISPEIKAEKNLPESGTMWFNTPGGGIFGLFDMPDVVEFAGAYRGELLGGTLAAFAVGTAGLSLIPSSIFIGLGAGLGKGLDEVQEIVEGTQQQPADEIAGDMAIAFAFNLGANAIIGGGAKLLGKVIKGGGNPDAQVISDLIDKGVSPGVAKATAIQMHRTATRKGLDEGLRPTVQDATGKAVLGRLQAIHEGIFPNRVAARSNRKYVEGLIRKFQDGELSPRAFGAALDQNAKDVTAQISNAMKNPDEAVKLANQHLHDVIGQEIDLLKLAYTTGDETAVAFQNEMVRMVRLWQNNNKELYDNASKLLGNAKLFKTSDLKRTAKEHLLAPLAKEQGLGNNPVYKYIIGKTDDYTLSELQSLRSVVNNSRSGDLVGDLTDHQLKGLSNKIDEMFESANALIKERQFSINKGNATYGDAGLTPPPGSNSTTFLPREYKPRILAQWADGFEKFKAANAYYKKGAETFKTGAVNMLNRNIKDGYFADLSSVVETVVQNGKPELLKNYLKAVTPQGSVRGILQDVPETQWQAMAQAAERGEITAVNSLLESNFPSLKGSFVPGGDPRKIGLSFKPSQFLETMPKDDPYRKRILGELAETFRLHAEDSAAAASGATHRDVSRQMLANTWMKMTREGATDLGVVDPAAFRRSFDKLGKEVQEELFGKYEATQLRKVLNDFALVAPDQVKGGFRFGTTSPDTITNSNMRNIVSNLQSDVAEAQAQSTNAMFQAVKGGTIVDADSLIQAAVKDPKLLDDLIAVVPDDVLNQPFGLRDAAMSRIIRQAFPDGITESAVISGAWQDGMGGAIANMNQRGSLNRILGPETVQDLIKVTKLPVGDQALKGKGGLSSALYAATIGMRILAEPVSGLISVASIYTSGRILRSKTFLKLMTSPNIRASELKAGIKALTDDIFSKARADGINITRKQANAAAKKQLGDLSILRRLFSEVAGAEARIIASAKASESVGPEQRQAAGRVISQAAEEVRPIVQKIQQRLPAQVGSELGIPGAQVAQAQETPQQRAARIMAEIEQAKLTGAPATQ